MAFLYKNFVFSALTADLGDNAGNDDNEISIDSAKRQQFLDLLGADGDREAVLVIREDRAGGTTDFEIVKLTDVQGNNLVVERAHEGSDSKAFTTNARVSNVVTAERASILGGIANTDLEPEGERSIGLAAKPFMDVHAKNLKVRHGEDGDGNALEFTIKPQSAESISENQDLLLPREGGTFARLEDSIEVHPGCFSGSLCVEPVADEVADAIARGHTSIGDGIYVIAYYEEAGQQRLKLAKYNDGVESNNLRTLLNLVAIPSDDEDAETLYRLNTPGHTITVGGVSNLSFSDVLLKTVGDYETAEGDLSAGFTLALVNTWLESKSFSRKPQGQLVAQKIYGQDISADRVVANNLRLPVLARSPGKDDDSTKGYEAGSLVYSSTRKCSYVCVSAANGAAIWRPSGMLEIDNLEHLLQWRGESHSSSFTATPSTIGGKKFGDHNRLYFAANAARSNVSRIPYSATLANFVVDSSVFDDGATHDLAEGSLSVQYVSETSVRLTMQTWTAWIGHHHGASTTQVGWSVNIYGD